MKKFRKIELRGGMNQRINRRIQRKKDKEIEEWKMKEPILNNIRMEE